VIAAPRICGTTQKFIWLVVSAAYAKTKLAQIRRPVVVDCVQLMFSAFTSWFVECETVVEIVEIEKVEEASVL
jgi:hypothetical protein